MGFARFWSWISMSLGISCDHFWLCIFLPYILKTGFRGFRNPQKTLNFPQKYCLKTRKLSILHCVRELEPSLPFYFSTFPLLGHFSSCNTHFSWFAFDILLIFAFVLQNFIVAIYALFPQIFWDWKAESANFCTFRMYVSSNIEMV